MEDYTFEEKSLIIHYAMGLRIKGRSMVKLAKDLGISPQSLYNWRCKSEFRVPLRADRFDAIWRWYKENDREALEYGIERMELEAIRAKRAAKIEAENE